MRQVCTLFPLRKGFPLLVISFFLSLFTFAGSKNGVLENEYRNKPVSSPIAPAPLAGEAKPILIIGASANKFSQYPAEILLAEGLNGFSTTDISQVSAGMLSGYEVIIVGHIPLTDAQATMLRSWTEAGGTLIAFRPDSRLSGLLGLSPLGGTLANKYLLINTASGPGQGLVNQSIQYHSAADLYALNGASSLATLYSNASTPTSYPAVTINNVGVNGGKAVAFTYDLARSVVYTRQGNPAWEKQERDGSSPIRSNDLFFGGGEPDWVDMNKVSIPQADEQQRLLANIIIQSNSRPMPRFWYLPRGLKAAVMMTGDDHGNGGTSARLNQYLQLSTDNSPEAVADWRAIRSTSYIYSYTPISDAGIKNFQDQGFEIALHVNTGCLDYTPKSLESNFTAQLADLKARFPSLNTPTTNRTHCLPWSDWSTHPKVEAGKGIRLDVNYYTWPGSWLQDRPGMITGSGFPMRFADLDGTLINCYQGNTHMTDESDQTFPNTIDQLLDKAVGKEGFYGIFTANMHTDAATSDGSDKIIASAKARNVPVISAKQVLTWLDGRNASSFGDLAWSENTLSFSLSVAAGAHKLEGMLPIFAGTNRLVNLTTGGVAVSYRTEKIKGIEYAFFPAATGNYIATYGINNPPVVTISSPANNSTFEAPANIVVDVSASKADGSVTKVEFFNGSVKLGEDVDGSNGWSFNWTNVEAGAYSLIAKATDDKGAVTSSSEVKISVSVSCPCSVFLPSEVPGGSLFNDSNQPLQLGMKFRASSSGFVTGVRFYKQSGNTGTHIGQLYSAAGILLAEATFVNESATGWQEVAFSSPVAISANTTYVISYHSSSGYYSVTNPYFTAGKTNGPLKALLNGEDGPNGLYRYTNTPAMPNSNYLSANYWVDVIFNNESTPVNKEPSVAISSPSDTASFTAPATIVITATASDADGTIAKVEFFNDTVKLGEALNSPYEFSWSGVAAGTYALTARAIDNNGAVATSSAINVEVKTPVNKEPGIFISSPANNATFTAPATVGISASASDVDGSIVKVEFFQDSIKLGEDLTSPYEFNWSEVAAGSYSLTAKAVDDKGAEAISEVVTVSISNPANKEPSVAIISPSDTASFIAPADVIIEASASDVDGSIAKVEFFRDTVKLGEALSSPYSYNWSNVPAGTYGVSAKATDDKGAITTSAVVSVVVSVPANLAPQANAGADQVLTAGLGGTASVTLDGSGSNDADGSIQSYSWKKDTVTLATAVQPTINLAIGVHSIRLTIADDKGATASDEVVVTVNPPANTAPTVNAGADKSISLPVNTASFTATASDAEGTVETYSWTILSSPSGSSPALTGEATAQLDVTVDLAGAYVFQVTVTDNSGATAFDQVNLTVNEAPVNKAPVANAGGDKAITLPVSSVVLDGSGTDSDGTISSYRWSQDSGPGTATFSSINDAAPTLSELVAGTYLFSLTVTDDKGAVSAADQVSVVVNGAPIPNTAPVANAGADQTLTAGASGTATVTLDGSGSNDADGSISSYSWKKDTVTLATGVSPTLSLAVGVHSIRLTVSDDKGATGTDEVVVTVNPPANTAPTVNAGADKSITLPENSSSFTATASDADGTITTYLWEQLSGPAATLRNTSTATLSLSNLLEGSYTFKVTVTDNGDATASDEVSLVVNAASPASCSALALDGTNKLTLVKSLVLSGDFTIEYWAKLSGNISNSDAPVSGGNSQYINYYKAQARLYSKGATGGNDPIVASHKTVADVWTHYAFVRQGNQMKVYINGVEDTGGKATNAWTGNFTIDNLGQGAGFLAGELDEVRIWSRARSGTEIAGNYNKGVAPTTNGLAAYFNFNEAGEIVKDVSGNGYDSQSLSSGISRKDSSAPLTDCTSGPETNQQPLVNAGADKSITLPENSTSFTATASDADGTITTYLWEQLSGPEVVLSGSATATLSLANLAVGNYTFRVSVTDNEGGTASDQVSLTVNGETSGNQVPVANAGADKTLTLPDNSTVLSGTAIDSDGRFVAFRWEKVSGPSVTMSGQNTANVALTNLVAGIYVFRFSATDNDGATGFDEMTLTVIGTGTPANTAPIANAGGDKAITLPVSSVVLDGSGTDSDGTISSYRWSQDSGPGTAAFSSINDAAPTLSELVAGTYLFSLTVTDDKGAVSAADQVSVVVNGAPTPNTAPVANAGADQSLTAGASGTATVTLDGSGSNDADGSISSYSWKESGVEIATGVSPTLSLAVGVHSISLTVTDNKGATGTDEVVVTVNAGTTPNTAPTVNAGADKSITLPENSSSFTATASDADGTITTYLWEQLSGPAASLSSTNTATLSLSNLLEGSYTFKVTVTDNGDATASDEVSLVVNAAAVLAAPSNLIAQGVSSSQINLSWQDNTTEETGFVLERAVRDNFTGSVAKISLAANTSSYQDRNKKTGVTFYYRVKAVKGTTSSDYSNVATAVPAAVANEGIAANNTNSVSAYPNTFTTFVNLEVPPEEPQAYAVSVYDLLGRTVYKGSFSSSLQNISIHRMDLSDPAIRQGVYLVQVVHQESGSSQVIKILKAW